MTAPAVTGRPVQFLKPRHGRSRVGSRLVDLSCPRPETMRCLPVVLLWACIGVAPFCTSPVCAEPYNPYAVAQEPLAPVAPDGTIQWGTFFKSARMQREYERLWKMGACRGTNRAITEPVENNRVVIDRLPEGDFTGVVQGSSGTIKGGVIAFSDKATPGRTLVAQLHPAGVSTLSVTGQSTAAILRPGMIVRLRATVDDRGRSADTVPTLTIVTPPAGFVPDSILPGRVETIVGSVTRVNTDALLLALPSGKVRRLAISISDATVVMVDAADPVLVEPGDTIELTGRLWSGDGAAADGTVFASRVSVTKPAPKAGAGTATPGPVLAGRRNSP